MGDQQNTLTYEIIKAAVAGEKWLVFTFGKWYSYDARNRYKPEQKAKAAVLDSVSGIFVSIFIDFV